jgi:hypothetical protein
MGKRGPRPDETYRPEVEAEAVADLTVSAASLYEKLCEAHPEEVDKTGFPVERTVRDWVRKARPLAAEPDPSGTWSPAETEGAEARIILDVLAELMRSSDGGVNTITRSEADWLVRLFHAAPGLHPHLTYRLAQTYIARLTRGEPTVDLDTWIAFAPWLSNERMEAYERLRATEPQHRWVKYLDYVQERRPKSEVAKVMEANGLGLDAQGLGPDDLIQVPATTTRDSARTLHYLSRVLQTRIQVVLQQAEGRRLVISPYALTSRGEPDSSDAVYVREDAMAADADPPGRIRPPATKKERGKKS